MKIVTILLVCFLVSCSVRADWQAQNWGLDSLSRCAVNVSKAESKARDKDRPLVAVIDTGAYMNHSVLYDYMEKGGYDFADKTRIISDKYGHGTHVTGLVLAASGFRARILPIRYFVASKDRHNGKLLIKAIYHAIDAGVRIVNISGSGNIFDEDEWAAIKFGAEKGILFVVAAGNDKKNISVKPVYPASYDLPNQITVGSVNYDGALAPSSNWGPLVDVAAPGDYIFSTYKDGSFNYMSGTSMATAFVSGIAALLLSHNPNLTPSELKTIIRESTNKITTLSGLIASGGCVDAYAALNLSKAKKFAHKQN